MLDKNQFLLFKTRPAHVVFIFTQHSWNSGQNKMLLALEQIIVPPGHQLLLKIARSTSVLVP